MTKTVDHNPPSVGQTTEHERSYIFTVVVMLILAKRYSIPVMIFQPLTSSPHTEES